MMRICELADHDVDKCRSCRFDVYATTRTEPGLPFDLRPESVVEMLTRAFSVASERSEVDEVLELRAAFADHSHSQR